MVLLSTLVWLGSVQLFGFGDVATGSPRSEEFLSAPGYEGSGNRLLTAEGKSTGLVFPEGYSVYTIGRDAYGHPIGGLRGSFSGAYMVESAVAIQFRQGKYRIFRTLPKFTETRISAQDCRGRLIGNSFNNGPVNFDLPADESHGFLVSQGRTIDLGPADEVWFGSDGSVRGYFFADKCGRPMHGLVMGETLRYEFVWRQGKRDTLPNPEPVESVVTGSTTGATGWGLGVN